MVFCAKSYDHVLEVSDVKYICLLYIIYFYIYYVYIIYLYVIYKYVNMYNLYNINYVKNNPKL